MPLGHTNKAKLGVKLLSSDLTSLTSELWLSVHFNEHTMAAAFLFKCMGEHAFSSTPYVLNP